MIRLEAEAAGHAAAPRVGHRHGRAHFLEQTLLVTDAAERLLMTMPMEQDRLRKAWRRIALHPGHQELGQRTGLLRKTLCERVVGEQVEELVTKYRQAAWLEHDYGRVVFEVRLQLGENLEQHPPGLPEKAVIIERTSAAERSSRQHNLATRSFEDLRRRNRRVRMEIVVERVRPQQHLLCRQTSGVGMYGPRTEPLNERAIREAGDRPLLRDAGDRLGQIGRQRRAGDRVHDPRST